MAWALALALVAALSPVAAEVTRADLDGWLSERPLADPPAPGSAIVYGNLESVRPYIPPGYFDEFAYEHVTIRIQPTVHHVGDRAYLAASARFAGKARLGDAGELENYIAGRPFSDTQIAAAGPAAAGLMVAWNQTHRWQYFGYKVDETSFSYLGTDGTGEAPQPLHGLEGGGIVQRRLTARFHRVYLNHLSWLSDADYRLEVEGANRRLHKDFMEFLSPFNVADTKFVVERSLDPYEEDQVNTYSPTERRVRRYSAKERSDSFMGSDVTLDDFDGFAGRVLDYRWTYLGRKQLLDVSDAAEPLLRFGGPLSRAIIDRWQLRECHVVELRSIWSGHPYKSRLLFIDADTYDVAVALAFDKHDRLWKIFDPIYRVTHNRGSDSRGTISSWRGQANIDLIRGTATVAQAISDTEHPTMTPADVRNIFSVSSLTAGH